MSPTECATLLKCTAQKIRHCLGVWCKIDNGSSCNGEGDLFSLRTDDHTSCILLGRWNWGTCNRNASCLTSCKSSNIIFIIEFKRYGNQHLVETGQPLHCRMNSHPSDVVYRRTDKSSVTVHFNNAAFSVGDMTVMVIYQLYSLDPTLQKIRESRWIRDLRTAFMQGMNLRVDSL